MMCHSDLHSAIFSQDVEEIERLLDEGANVDAADHDGITALHIASMNNSSNIVQILISHGASIDPKSSYRIKSYTPLHYAVERGHEAIVKILLSNKADIKLRTHTGMSPLDIAVQEKHVDIARELLSYRASVNCPSSPTISLSNRVFRNYQPLHRAVENGHNELIELLLDNGADINADAVSIVDGAGYRYSSESEWTPLHIAVEKGYVDITRTLLQRGANVNSGKYGNRVSPLCVAMKEASGTGELLAYLKNPENIIQPVRDTKYEIITNLLLEHGATFVPELEIYQAGLHGAVKMGNMKAVEYILKCFPDGINTFRNANEANCTLLHTAASVWNTKSAEFLIRHGANVNAVDDYGHTPIFYVVIQKDEILMDAPKNRRDDRKIAKLLLSHGPNVDCIDEDMQTPLHHAVKQSNYERVKFLLMRKACVESHVDGIIHPLHLAVMKEDVEIVKVLLNSGARINSVCAQSCTSSSNSTKRGSVSGSQESLNYCSSSPGVKSYPMDQVPLVFDSLLVGSWTPLHCSVKHGHEQFVKLLLSKADANCTNNSTPLYSAIHTGHHRIVKLLLDHKFGIDIKDKELKKALFTAVRAGYIKTIEFVFKFYPAINAIVDHKGRTLLHIAVVYYKLSVIDGVKEQEVVELLIKHQCDLNAPDEEGGTPLMLALESLSYCRGEPIDDTVKCLLEHGARIDPTDSDLQTIIRGLLEDKALPILELLFQYCTDVKRLLNANGQPFLHDAIKENYPNVARFLIKYGADANATNIFGQRALHLAIDSDLEFVEMLIENGVDIDGRENNGKTVLHWVASNSCKRLIPVMEILLKNGADVNIKSNENLTALDYSLKYLRPSDVTRVILLKHLLKMKAANLYLSQHDLESINLCADNENSLVDYKNLYTNLKAECDVMRKTKIADTSIFFYDVLTGIDCARNESVVKALESHDYETKFPLYSDWIKNNFEKAQKRVNLLSRVETISNSLLGYELPVGVPRKIFRYLSNYDLEKLTEAYSNETG